MRPATAVPGATSSVGTPSRTRAPDRRVLPIIALIVFFVYAIVVVLSVRHYQGNVSSLIGANDVVLKGHNEGLGRHIVVFRTTGYDGLAYYTIAGDPFLQRPTLLDAFRYQRIGYPVVVWAVSLGHRAWEPAAMVAVNLAAALAVAYLSGLIILQLGGGASTWWALACAINPSLLIGVQRDLAEPLMTALALTAVLLYLRRHMGWAAVFLALALLTREAAALFLAPLALAEVGARRWRDAAVLALCIVPYLAWQVVLLRAFGRSGLGASQSHVLQPLAGIIAVARATVHSSGAHRVGWFSVIAVIAFVFASAVIAGIRLWKRRDVMTGGVFLHAVTALLAGPDIWLGFASAARVFGGMYPLTVFAFARARPRSRSLALLSGMIILLTIFTFVRFVLQNPVQAYYLTP